MKSYLNSIDQPAVGDIIAPGDGSNYYGRIIVVTKFTVYHKCLRTENAYSNNLYGFKLKYYKIDTTIPKQEFNFIG